LPSRHSTKKEEVDHKYGTDRLADDDGWENFMVLLKVGGCPGQVAELAVKYLKTRRSDHESDEICAMAKI
jgi:hypothetical protein